MPLRSVRRRRILLFTQAGTALSYCFWFFAHSFLLLVARLIGGIMAGNISIVSAAVSDVTTAEKRAHGMGLIGAGIGLGFVFGPALGGLSAGWNLTASFPEFARFGLHPFSGAALLSFVLATRNLIWAMMRFPETCTRTTRKPAKAAPCAPGPPWPASIARACAARTWLTSATS
ncbi:MAG: MFS transporter [Planctomycetota bacterium]